MTYLKLKFNRYSLIYYANDAKRKPSDCIVKINCYSEGQKVEKFLGDVLSPVLTIKFFKNDSEIPPNGFEEYCAAEKLIKKYGPVWKIKLHYPISQFNDIISILRYYEKKNLYLFIETDSLKGGISTTKELVEEKEKK